MDFQSGNQRRTNMDTSNYEHLRCRISEAARDVLNRTLTFEEAAAKYDVTAEYIESKIKDSLWEPPRSATNIPSVIAELRQAPPAPRDVLTAEEKKLKDTFGNRSWVMLSACLGQAASAVQHKELTLRAACEKFDVSPEDVQRRMKDPTYEPERTLAPGKKPLENYPRSYKEL
jgi:hypothetical protein